MPNTVFAVHRRNWLRTDTGWLRLPGDTRLATFPTREEADADRLRRESAARAVVNPFRCGGNALHHQTGLDADRLHDWFLDAGVEPPADRRWAEWWDAHAANLSDAARARLWAAFDRLTFFETVEHPNLRVLYAVVEVNWRYNDQGFTAEAEGGKPWELFRRREAAEAYCDEANDIRRDAWEDDIPEDEWSEFDNQERLRHATDPFGGPPKPRQWGNTISGDEAPFFEVIEVEWEGES